MSTATPTQLLDAWNQQQTAYIEHRADRTACVVEVLRQLERDLGHPLRVLDLGCGPGSLGTAVLEALPEATLVAVDRDPVLLRLFRETTRFTERTTFVDGDLRGDDWHAGLADGSIDAAISATALHWLAPRQLVAVHQALGRLVAPGGVVVNADHLDFDRLAHPWLREVAAAYRTDGERRLQAAGAMGWDEWFQQVVQLPGWQAEVEERQRRWADDVPPVHVDADFHLASLRAAGFSETAQVWQWLDDRIVLGRRPRG